jgi:hypothetical protein
MSKPLNCSPITGRPYEGFDMTAEKHRVKFPHEAWLFNPWSYKQRDASDVRTDPQGLLIVPPGRPMYATLKATPEPIDVQPEGLAAASASLRSGDTLADTLTERGKRYGKFADHAKITQDLKGVMRACPKWAALTSSQKEALEMVVHKIGRILNGDPDYDDSWVDVAGYSKLVADELQGIER